MSFDTFAWLFLILSLVVIQKIYVNSEKQNTEEFNYPAIQNRLFWILVITILYVITRLGSVVTEHLSTNVHSLTITSIWAIYAIVSVVYGVISRNKKSAFSRNWFTVPYTIKINCCRYGKCFNCGESNFIYWCWVYRCSHFKILLLK